MATTLKLKQIFEASQYSIKLDMDGVICNFAKAFKNVAGFDPKDGSANDKDSVYDVLQNVPEEFWSKMQWLPDGKQLWNYVKKLDVCICSTPMDNDSSKLGKKKWCRDNLGAQIKVILTKEKHKFADSHSILIDDRKKNIDQWIKAGGIGILHKNTKDTLRQLKRILG